MSVFRFAPSPNGFLHEGHAASALLNAALARRAQGVFLLRIEDIDRARCTRAFEAAVGEDLAWLGLDWPRPALRQSDHLPDYAAAQRQLREMGLLYPCFCTRGDVARQAGADPPRDPDGAPLYPGTCRRLDPATRAARLSRGDPHAWRLDMAAAALRAPGLAWTEAHEGRSSRVVANPLRWGDVILARKDIGTSYHVAVVVDDARQGVTHVVRGRDLFAATAVHRLLQALLALPEPVYRHHPLIRDGGGEKLAKSRGSKPLRALRAEGVEPQALAARLLAAVAAEGSAP